MLIRRSIGCLVLIATVSMASAWNGTGHAQVADIAWAKLTRTSRVKIAKMFMVGDSVSRGERTSDYTVPKLNDEAISDEFLEKTVRPVFRRAASWCDDIKGGASTNYEARIDADNAASPGVDPSARGENTRCKTWHYYDDPINAPGDSAPHPARESNAVRALALIRGQFEKQAASSTPDVKEELYDLFWLEHLFGDLTQPLHCSESYVLSPKGDAGGNTFRTMAPNDFRPGSPVNLHSYWDSGIDHAVAADGSLGQGSDVEKVTTTWLSEEEATPAAADVRDLDPMSWVVKGRNLALKYVYAGIQPDGVPSDDYKKAQADLCKKQAVLGGLRLANYLNSKLK